MLNNKEKFKTVISELLNNANSNIIIKKIKCSLGEINILYIKQLTDIEKLTSNIIRPLMEFIGDNNKLLNSDTAINQIFFVADIVLESDSSLILEHILNGQTVIILPNENNYLIANIKKFEKRAVESPELTFSLRGPRDSFSEDLDTNLSLIRYRIKDKELKIENFLVGKRTKSKVALLYLGDVANDKPVNLIRERINKIETDGVYESGELQKALLNNKFSLFPQMGLAERSDMACGALLEGKVIVLVEGSGLALIAPKTFGEFFVSCDDGYDNQYSSAFLKLLRQVAALFSVSLSSLFIIVSSFEHDILPAEYINSLALSRANVPWNAFTGVLLLEVIIEILREALLRVPKQIGPAVGIVGGIIIGQASISAGIFSPLLLIMVALEFMSSFVASDYTIMNSLRVCKLFLIIITGVVDLFGFTMGFCFLMTNIISTNSFGVPYLSPVAPFNFMDFKNSYFFNKKIATNRPHFLKTKDNVRTKNK